MTPAIIIVDHGSRRLESNQMLEELAGLYAGRFAHEIQIVEPAHMELCEPSIATAYGRCVRRGASRVVVVPFFLSFGKHWTHDIPSLLSQAAADFPGTEYQLVEPLGIDDLMLDLLHKRAADTEQPVYGSGQADPRIEGLEPTQRREQCTSCPFKVMPRRLDRRQAEVRLMGDRVLGQLRRLNLTLPPAVKPVASYVPVRQAGGLLFVSGQLPMRDGALVATGKVPTSTSLDAAQAAARQCVLNALAAVQETVGDLDRITGVVRVGVFVQSENDFAEQHKVANGASDLLAELFGPAGAHARAAVGVNALPLNASVEVEFVFAV